MAYIEIKHLKKYFPVSGGILHAVDDVNLSIQKGETIGIVGESGCGKSTIGKTLIRLHEPTSGQIFFDGQEITALSKKEFKPLRAQMQMIFQDPSSSLDSRMSVSQLIAEPLRIYNICRGKEEIRKRVLEVMDTVGIASRYENTYPHELDGGRRQRIVIARALTLNPKFVVCDEPVSALDVSVQAQVLNLLQDLQKAHGLTYMFITHDLSVVRHISNSIYVMYLGQVVEHCGSKTLFKKTLHPYSQALLSSIPSTNIHKQTNRIILKGELSSPVDPPKRCRFAPRCMYATDECFNSEPVLENVGDDHLVACHHVRRINQAIL